MGDYRSGIPTESPISPWGQPGFHRTDREPHRERLLWRLAFSSVVLAICSEVFLVAFVYSERGIRVHPVIAPLLPPPFLCLCVALIALSGGIALGLSTWRLAARDLAMMRKGLMDSGGLLATVQAGGEGLLAFALNGMLALISVGVLFGTKG